MQEAFDVWLKPVRNLSTKVEIGGQKRIMLRKVMQRKKITAIQGRKITAREKS